MISPYIAIPSLSPAISNNQVAIPGFSTTAARPELAVPDNAIPAPIVDPATAIPAPINLPPERAAVPPCATAITTMEDKAANMIKILKNSKYLDNFFDTLFSLPPNLTCFSLTYKYTSTSSDINQIK